MLKRTLGIIISAVMMLGFFGLTACDSEKRPEIKTNSSYGFTLITTVSEKSVRVGDTITITIKLVNPYDKDVVIEIPYTRYGQDGTEVEDLIGFVTGPIEYTFDDLRLVYGNPDRALYTQQFIPPIQVVFKKDQIVEKTFEYTVKEEDFYLWSFGVFRCYPGPYDKLYVILYEEMSLDVIKE